MPQSSVSQIHASVSILMCIFLPAFLPRMGACSHYIRFLANSQIFLDGIAGSVWIVLFLSSFDYLYIPLLMLEIATKPIHIFLDFNAVIVSLDSLPSEIQQSCVNSIEKENLSEIPETGMAVLQQQYVLIVYQNRKKLLAVVLMVYVCQGCQNFPESIVIVNVLLYNR